MPTSDPVEAFEEEFRKRTGTRYAIAVNSGTSGLMTCMLALGLNAGEKVVTTPLTHISTSNSILFGGGIPIFSDVGKDSFCLDSSTALRYLDHSTRAVLGVHLYGMPFDCDGLREICHKKDILLIEDAAQALGASVGQRKVGNLGDAAVFSFYATKHINLGEGGMITTNDNDFAEKCKMIRSHGQSRPYYHSHLGYNFRLPRIIAEIGVKEIVRMESSLRRRRSLSKIYRDEFENNRQIQMQEIPDQVVHSYYMFPLLIEGIRPNQIDLISKKVRRKTGHELKRGYGLLSYQQPFYLKIRDSFWAANVMNFPDYRKTKCPNAEYVVERLLELPTDQSVNESQAQEIAKSIKDGLNSAF